MATKNVTKLVGSELLKALESEASFELKQTRHLVEEACCKDISAYWSGAGLGEISRASILTLVTPAIAGGQWGFNSLISRLETLNVADNQLEEIANEILELSGPHAKILNYSRFRSGAVQAYVSQCKPSSFDAEVLGIPELTSKAYKNNVEKVLNTRISDIDSLRLWANQISDLMELLSVEQDRQRATVDEASGKSRKGSVSTKSVSSYSKHWLSFVEEKLSSEVGGKWNGDPEESTAERSRQLTGYEAISWNKMKNSLLESKSTRRSFSNDRKSQTKKSVSNNDKFITDIHDLGGRKLTISYNLPGVDVDLIKPAVNSLRGHMIINPKSAHASVNMKSDSSYLSIDLDNPKKSDVETVEILLNSHI